jgi:glutathione S-transferase
MKLYIHPVSTTSRPVMLFAEEEGIKVDVKVVDLMTGEHLKEPFASLNPNKLVPVLEDDGFVLTESSAILKYLADKTGSAAYPKDLKERARVNERMDWTNTSFGREYAYHLCYPQLFPHHRRRSDEAQEATIAWGAEKATAALRILNDEFLGHGEKYVAGPRLTIADYFMSCAVTLGECIGADFAKFPNARAWIDRMKSLDSWNRVNETFYGWVGSIDKSKFVRV